MRRHYHSIHCIVPPIVLDQIARRGTDAQREWALETMASDHSLRAARIANAGRIQRGGRRRADVMSAGGGGQPQRTIRDAENKENLSGKIVRQEGDGATGDEAVDEAYDGLGATYTFFCDIFDRDSIDDEAMPLDATVHYGLNYDNAFWDGQRMVFGDGDGSLFVRFTKSLDVIGHELAHGVTEDEAGLQYFNQSGALNESMSDVLGSLVKQHHLQQKADDADWLIGADLLGPDVEGTALRSMKAPGTAYDDDVLGKDPQPAHMKDFVQTTQDNGGVHINSGIPNHAFYLTAVALGGFAWERAGRVWYEALRDPRLTQSSRFTTFAKATVRQATRLYGDTSEEAGAVKEGWRSVGVRT